MTFRQLPPDLVATLRETVSLGVITGAGVSAESGIQTYRGQGGLYDDEAEGDRTVEALSAPTLAADPDRTWGVVAHLARQTIQAKPNPAHQALVAMEATLERFILLTQNVDGLHRLAGTRNMIDIHGDVLETRCSSCAFHGDLSVEDLQALTGTPRCPQCACGLRPHVVLFGEMLPEAKIRRLHEEFYERPPEVVLIAGTSAIFPYIAEPVLLAAQAGHPTIEVNPEPTPLSDRVRWSLRGKAGEIFPQIAAALASRA